MGNMCFSGNKDRVGDQKKDKPGQEKPVTTTATEEKPAASLEEVKPAPSLEEDKPAPSLEEEKPAPSLEEDKPAPSLEEDKPAPSLEEEKPVPALEGEKPAPSLEEGKPPVPQAKPVSEAKPEKKRVPALAKPASKPAAQMASDHGNIQIIKNAAAWKAKLEEAKNAGKIVVVDFTASWCGPCRLMSPIFTEFSKKFESLLFLKVDIDEVQDVTAEWEVRAMPTFVFIKDGKKLDKIVGSNKDELERKCNQYASTTVSSSA
jgi:thioredoxin 1